MYMSGATRPTTLSELEPHRYRMSNSFAAQWATFHFQSSSCDEQHVNLASLFLATQPVKRESGTKCIWSSLHTLKCRRLGELSKQTFRI